MRGLNLLSEGISAACVPVTVILNHDVSVSLGLGWTSTRSSQLPQRRLTHACTRIRKAGDVNSARKTLNKKETGMRIQKRARGRVELRRSWQAGSQKRPHPIGHSVGVGQAKSGGLGTMTAT